MLLKDGGDVLDRESSGSDKRGGTLEQLKLREGFVGETKEKVVESMGFTANSNSTSLSFKSKYSINTST